MAEPKSKPLHHMHVFGANLNKSSMSALVNDYANIPPNVVPTYLKDNLDEDKIALIKGANSLVCTVRDKLNAKVLEEISNHKIKLIQMMALNCNNVDIEAAKKFGIQISYCPFYTPESIAEHAFALLLTINRHIHRAYNRVREGNFELDGLLGMDLHGKTIGILGFGKVGRVVARIALGFGMKVLAFDKVIKNEEKLAVEFLSLEEVLNKSDVVSLHLNENKDTMYIINEKTIGMMKDNAFLINTARGTLINSEDLLKALLKGKFAGVGLDVYEDKYEVFFRNLTGETLMDETLARLKTIPNVLITCRQGNWTLENSILTFESLTKDLISFMETGKVINSLY